MQVISPVDDLLTQKAIAQLHYCIVTLLQTVEFTLGDLKKGCKPIKLNAALTIDLICVRQFFPQDFRPTLDQLWVFGVCLNGYATHSSCFRTRKGRASATV